MCEGVLGENRPQALQKQPNVEHRESRMCEGLLRGNRPQALQKQHRVGLGGNLGHVAGSATSRRGEGSFDGATE